MKSMRELAEELKEKREKYRQGGGPEKIERQHQRGKLTARERLEILLDPGSFFEIGILASEWWEPWVPADGVVTGFGTIDGRPVCVASYDFTVLGGSIGRYGEAKVTRLREWALKERIPMIWLIDSAGARIHPGNRDIDDVSEFADSGYLFKEQVIMSGVVPQIAAMVGPGAAGTAYIPGLADFVPMVEGKSSMALGGPPLVKAATGEDITEEELGGARMHNEISGVADQLVATDEECLKMVRHYLSFMPQNCLEKPPRKPYTFIRDRELLPDKVLDLVPTNPRSAYDMMKLIKMIVDDPNDILEIKPLFARNIITCFGRIAGRAVGIVANNPKFLGGALDVDASDKAARFVNLCDAFNIPLVFLQDVPGFMVGSQVERQGIIRHGAKMLYAVARATVPKLTVIIRKAYGAGYYVMNGRAYDPDLIVSWPTGEISVMGPEGMVSIAGKKLFGGVEPDPQVKEQIIEAIRQGIDIYRVARKAYVDDVIDPRETRIALAMGLLLTENKRVERPWRKHGVWPV
jgi:acetyl-CoA carboxylase carboxyltransferase component